MQWPSGRGYAQRWDVNFGEFAFHALGLIRIGFGLFTGYDLAPWMPEKQEAICGRIGNDYS
jgi:hypothetical protein